MAELDLNMFKTACMAISRDCEQVGDWRMEVTRRGESHKNVDQQAHGRSTDLADKK